MPLKQKTISPLTWKKFASIIRYISMEKQAQAAIETDIKFAKALRVIIRKLEQDFDI